MQTKRLSTEMCEEAVNNAVKKEVQEGGRIRYWAFVKELDRMVRVVLLEDDETIHNAFMDRSFKFEKKEK